MTTSRYSEVSRRAFLGGVSMAALAGLAACAGQTSSPTTTAPASTTPAGTTPPPTPSKVPSSAAAGGALPATAKATITFTYAAPGGGMSKNPYYVVWIEDANGAYVKTVLLNHLSGNDRWLNQLSAWYATSHGSDATTSGTKPAGTYTAVWDGTDHTGARVPAGEYRICVESNVEHGNDSLIRSKQALGAAPLQVDLGTNGSMSAKLAWTV